MVTFTEIESILLLAVKLSDNSIKDDCGENEYQGKHALQVEDHRCSSFPKEIRRSSVLLPRVGASDTVGSRNRQNCTSIIIY